MGEQLLWVVEMKLGKRYEPTVGVSLNRAYGRLQLHEWRKDNPGFQFRLARYARLSAQPVGKG